MDKILLSEGFRFAPRRFSSVQNLGNYPVGWQGRAPLGDLFRYPPQLIGGVWTALDIHARMPLRAIATANSSLKDLLSFLIAGAEPN